MDNGITWIKTVRCKQIHGMSSVQNFRAHWVTITGLTENAVTGEVTLKVSSWGGTAELSFNDMYNATGALSDIGVVYFDCPK
jgi:hypothetical protein